MLMEEEKIILSLVSVGRDGLDQFVDTLQVDCQEARELANRLIHSGHLIQRGYYFQDMLSYNLTELGSESIKPVLSSRLEGSKSLNLLDDQFKVLLYLSKGQVSKIELERSIPEILGGAIQSILNDLEEKDLIRITGFFQVFAQLTDEGRSRLNQLS